MWGAPGLGRRHSDSQGRATAARLLGLDLERRLRARPPMVKEATRLSPHPPSWFRWGFHLDHYFHGRTEEALAEAQLMDGEGDFRMPLYLAAAYGQLGRVEEAAPAVAELQGLWILPTEDLRAELIERHAFAPELADRLRGSAHSCGALDWFYVPHETANK